jgi:hypothetical protein
MALTLQIVEVQAQSIQGLSGPYLCKAEDGHRYYVKGWHSGNESQFCEMLGWYLAQAFGLPVPHAQALELCEDLYEELPKHLQGIGKGPLFGLQEVSPARWFEIADIARTPLQLRRDLLVFDYWVCNEDRGLGNPNLLVRDSDSAVIVIDHNRIFSALLPLELINDHLFAGEWQAISGDLVMRAQYEERLQDALQAWPVACNNLPLEWSWFKGLPGALVDFDLERVHTLLSRFNQQDFWEVQG